MTQIGFSNQEEWSKQYPIVFVDRHDLELLGLTAEQVDSLTESDMLDIAAAMSDIYTTSGYWEDLWICVSRVLRANEKELKTVAIQLAHNPLASSGTDKQTTGEWNETAS